MTFSFPTLPFYEASRRLAGRKPMPTVLSSAELAEVDSAILDKALFSARNYYDEVLEEFKRSLTSMTQPSSNAERGTGNAEQINRAEARTRIKELYDKIGYSPEEGTEGTLTDHSSDARIELVLKMNEWDAAGYGQFVRNQEPVLLVSHPAMELVRFEDRKEKRRWLERWRSAGGRVYAGKPAGLPLSEESVQEQGRLIARKDDQVWVNISRFGRPWPPFDFNSGVGVRPVRRKEAIELGVLADGQYVQPMPFRFSTEGKN
jgi:hypothetical protein